jgi:DNA-directed RNA polymerase subunit RPC12/RpoP
MKTMESISVNCPNCGAPIDLRNTETNEVQCSHCHSSVILKSRPHSKKKKIVQQSVQTENARESEVNPIFLSTGWAVASLLLGIFSIFGAIFPLFCLPINLVGLIAGLLGRRSPRRVLVVSAIIINSIGLMLNIVIGIFVMLFGQENLTTAVQNLLISQ